MRGHIQTKMIHTKPQPSLFDITMSKQEQSQFVDIQASIQNQFYPLPKNPQVNCIEPFTRGGDSTVLQIRDRCFRSKVIFLKIYFIYIIYYLYNGRITISRINGFWIRIQ